MSDDLSKFIADMKQKRDEMRLQLHLGTKEAEEEWDRVVDEWDRFLEKAQFDKSRDEVGDAAMQLALRMKDAYDRLRKALD